MNTLEKMIFGGAFVLSSLLPMKDANAQKMLNHIPNLFKQPSTTLQSY